jgi:hypothetical protein
MSISGIYALSFNGGEAIYVGQSQDIEKRTRSHLRELTKSKHYNYKIQDAYNKFGTPEIIILEECPCDTKVLIRAENFWIDEFDSCRNGLNLRDKDETALRGVNANRAKYSLEQVLAVFDYLLDVKNTPKQISEWTGVPVGNINSISRGASHVWLKSEYPEKYAKLESLKGKRIGIQNTLGSRNRVWPDLVSPVGTKYTGITNLKEFCRLHNLPYDQMCRLCSGRYRICHGWTLAHNTE